jgi:hypothetical protein
MRQETKVRRRWRFSTVLGRVAEVRSFLSREVQNYRIEHDRKVSFSVDATMAFNELNILLLRTQTLNRALQCSLYKMLIRVVFKRYMFRQLADFDERVPDFIAHSATMATTFEEISRAFMDELPRRYRVSEDRMENLRPILDRTLYSVLVSRVSMLRFVSNRLDVQAAVQNLMANEEWRKMTRSPSQSGRIKRTPILEKGVELMVPVVNCDSFALVLHSVLRIIEMIIMAIGPDKAEVIQETLSGIIAHSNVEVLAHWYYYVNHFFNGMGDMMADVIGGDAVTNWKCFNGVFKLILPENCPRLSFDQLAELPWDAPT